MNYESIYVHFSIHHCNISWLCQVVPVGFDTNESIDDGHKFACGVSFISSAPIVYSFGSNLQTDFERAFYELRKDSKIYVFEIDKRKIPTISSPYNDSIFIFNRGLGYQKRNDLSTLTELMKEFGHTYIGMYVMYSIYSMLCNGLCILIMTIVYEYYYPVGTYIIHYHRYWRYYYGST